jgi:transketolase
MTLADRIAAERARYPTKVIRQQFGESMCALARVRPDLVALTADLMFATGMDAFGAEFPDRILNLGIAEQNMTGVAAGLASCGKLPIVCGYASFTTLRAVEQAKVDCAYNAVKVVMVGLSAGLSYGVGGPTHQTFEDVAIMRAIPNTMVVVASDAISTSKALAAAAAQTGTTPIYLRFGRGPEYVFHDPASPFRIGEAIRLREGDDVCLVANGPMVFEALLAADALAVEGIRAEVLEVHTVKPIDHEAIHDAAGRVRAMVVVEEHSRFGGLGAAVLEVLDGGHSFPVVRIGLDDVYPPIGPTFELREALGLSAMQIAVTARRLLAS